VSLGHYAAYQKGRVLHRDLSVSNLMHIEKTTGVTGILLDWDLASLIDDQNAVIASNAKHRTGTVPFMSIHLLKASPAHKYCHDLESFFYILVWAAVHFDLQENKYLPTHPEFQDWNHPDLVKAAQPKISYLCDPSQLTPFVSDNFKTLLVTWIKALRELFYKVYIKNDTGLDNKDIDNTVWSQVMLKRLEKYITFESFMSAIDREPRSACT
jgi:hypothetical protein